MNTRKMAWFAIGPLGGALLGIVTVPIIAWFFSPDDIGRISMLQIAIGLFTLVFSLGLDQAYVREYHESDNPPALFKASLFPGLFLLLTVLVCLLLWPGLISAVLYEVDGGLLSGITVLCLIAAFVSRFFSLILRMQERGLAYSMSQVLPKVLFLCFIGSYVLLSVDFTLLQLIAAQAASIILTCLIYIWSTRKDWLQGLREKIDSSKQKEMLRFGFPLIFSGVAFWGLTATDKIFLRNLSSFEELGIYSVSVSFAAAATVLQSVFSTVWAPTVYKWTSHNDPDTLEKVQKVSRYILMCVVIIFSLVGICSGILDYMLPGEYSDVKFIVLSCIGFPLLYTLSETTVIGIGLSRKTQYSLFVTSSTLLINIIGNYVMVPKYGAAGAAVSSCVSFWVFFILRTEFSMRLWKRWSRFDLYAFTFLMVVGSSVTSIYGSTWHFGVILFWSIVLMVSILYFHSQIIDSVAWLSKKVRMYG